MGDFVVFPVRTTFCIACIGVLCLRRTSCMTQQRKIKQTVLWRGPCLG
jgi:hypothetical protein